MQNCILILKNVNSLKLKLNILIFLLIKLIFTWIYYVLRQFLINIRILIWAINSKNPLIWHLALCNNSVPPAKNIIKFNSPGNNNILRHLSISLVALFLLLLFQLLPLRRLCQLPAELLKLYKLVYLIKKKILKQEK